MAHTGYTFHVHVQDWTYLLLHSRSWQLCQALCIFSIDITSSKWSKIKALRQESSISKSCELHWYLLVSCPAPEQNKLHVYGHLPFCVDSWSVQTIRKSFVGLYSHCIRAIVSEHFLKDVLSFVSKQAVKGTKSRPLIICYRDFYGTIAVSIEAL